MNVSIAQLETDRLDIFRALREYSAQHEPIRLDQTGGALSKVEQPMTPPRWWLPGCRHRQGRTRVSHTRTSGKVRRA
jgi:hypothetical protein